MNTTSSVTIVHQHLQLCLPEAGLRFTTFCERRLMGKVVRKRVCDESYSLVRCATALYLHHALCFVSSFRAKVKTVSFLLPVDDIYTNRPVLTRPDNETRIKELTPITETDS